MEGWDGSFLKEGDGSEGENDGHMEEESESAGSLPRKRKGASTSSSKGGPPKSVTAIGSRGVAWRMTGPQTCLPPGNPPRSTANTLIRRRRSLSPSY